MEYIILSNKEEMHHYNFPIIIRYQYFGTRNFGFQIISAFSFFVFKIKERKTIL